MKTTLIVPVFNEASRWNSGYWNELLTIQEVDWIFVDDGSTDDTYEKLNSLPNPSRYQILKLSKNAGKGSAVRSGLLRFFELQKGESPEPEHTNSGPRIVGFIDGDGAFSKSDIARLIKILNEQASSPTSPSGPNTHPHNDSVWASRVALSGRDIQRTQVRHYLGRLIATILSVILGKIPYDSQCGFKIFIASEELEKTIAIPFKTRWFSDVELTLNWRVVNKKVLQIWEEPLYSWREVAGSHLSFTDIFRISFELITLIRLRNHSKVPDTNLDS